ncbi:metallophosphoesterase [Paenibacillus polysaccharolyticus]|uniref:metallophosphoesterase n=1 Tax=Paenibacillus polysaccharolyticus TaxID=582692 RepID=UPI00209DC9C8|nr:metallophosphoesterase [Paenibacillus polysaccharolyticus]MCP1132076.1 metallophosphoesterase [Paenibacillus polysaccharolyticus]
MMGKTPRLNSGNSPSRHSNGPNRSNAPLFPGKEKDHDPSRRMFQLRKHVMTVVASVLTLGYALWEPRRLQVNHIEIKFPSFPEAFNGLRVVHFSDVHLGFHTGRRELSKLAEQIKDQEPDLICFTGDIVERQSEPMRECVPILASMTARYGKFAVLGNHDYRGRQQQDVIDMFREAGFTLLLNQHIVIERGNEKFAVVGLDDALTGEPDLDEAVTGLSESVWKLLLMHEPDYADYAAPHGFGLQLSGHSHGGQVRFPWFGAMTTPRGSRKYVQGLHYTSKPQMPVYVNRGFGMTQLPIRFLCRPELTVLHLSRDDVSER